jgi:transcriptional regulator with XRE-family HTH domain
MTVGEKVRELRNQAGLTLPAVADLAGIHPVQLYQYERCLSNPTLRTIRKLARALGVGIAAFEDCELLGDERKGRKIKCSAG